MKRAYKGFDKNLSCRGFQFQVGETYTVPVVKENPRLCSSDGFHYCNTLEQCFEHYGDNGINRFCEIEVNGFFSEDNYKGISTSIKILKEIPKDELDKIRLDGRMHIDLVISLQKKYPQFIIGGSIALYLYGVRLDRFDAGVDVDLITPYFILIETDEHLTISDSDKKTSGGDFDSSIQVNGVGVDILINPKARYEIINYNGFNIKVNLLENIIEAKARYATKGNRKHKDDLRDMITKRVEELNLNF